MLEQTVAYTKSNLNVLELYITGAAYNYSPAVSDFKDQSAYDSVRSINILQYSYTTGSVKTVMSFDVTEEAISAALFSIGTTIFVMVLLVVRPPH